MSSSATPVAASSSIVVQVGQCGNQLGPQFFKLAQNDCTGFVDPLNFCRAVCIDTEDKVANLKNLNRGLQKVKYREGNLVNGHFGRGSNWAMGYNMEERYGYRGEYSFMESCLDKTRLEAERCDCFMSTVVMHSLAGGTGSGVGSRVTQELRDMFPNRYILSVVVAPLSVGENPMQCYNSLLCCSHLSQFSDQIVVLENDNFSSKFDKHSSAATSTPKSTASPKSANMGFDQINEQFGLSLAGLLFPTDNVVGDVRADKYKHVKVGMEVTELVRGVCPLPNLRFSRLDSIRKSSQTQNFEGMFPTLANVYKSSMRSESHLTAKCISCVAVLRGANDVLPKYETLKERLSFLRPVDWNPFWLDFWTSANSVVSLPGQKSPPSVSLCSNSSSIAGYLELVWNWARAKYEHNAYLHWYEKFECSKSDFEDAFNVVESVVRDYKEAIT